MRRDDFEWSDTKIARLKKRRADGLSYGAIAREMGLTRNAVIGKAARLGMRSKIMPPVNLGPTGGSKVKQARARGKPMKPLPEIPPPTQSVELPPDVSPHACTLFELEPASCRWPIGDEHWLFCGAARRADSSYCGRHHALAYKGTPVRTTIPMAWRGAA